MQQFPADNRYHHLGKKIFIFFAGAVVLAVVFFWATAYKQDYFTRMTTLYIFSDNATGIKRGMAVKILGFNIGEVENIAIEPNAKVRVKIIVQSDYMRFVTLDSRAKLFKEGMIGESVIEITPGSQGLRPVAHNAVLPFSRGHDLAEIANELYGDIQPVLKGVGQVVTAVNDPEGDIQQSLRNMNQTSKNALSVTEDIASRLPQLLNEAGSITKTVNDGLPAMIENSKRSLENIQSATSDLKQITATSAHDIPQVLQGGQVLVKDSLSIVNGVKEAWPVRNMIANPQEQPLLIDSYVQPSPSR